ncbi:hypothetical protein T484DRAFT_1921028 [Baffinella frigidus]|nr:hypothetical protein T484DRAFT_1921028 [Cryptophyta sp. CCMP2293]
MSVRVSPGTAITGAPAFEGGAGVEKDASVSSTFAASVLTSYAAAMAVRSDTHAMAIEIGGLTFTPGTYRSGSAINFAAGTVTLDGLNEPNPVFLFQALSTLVTAASTTFVLKNGAKAENVLWALGTAATLGANSVLPGSILAGTAITFGAKAELDGCALAQTAVTFSSEGSVVVPFPAEAAAPPPPSSSSVESLAHKGSVVVPSPAESAAAPPPSPPSSVESLARKVCGTYALQARATITFAGPQSTITGESPNPELVTRVGVGHEVLVPPSTAG